MTKLIFGCGYLGLRVARKFVAAGHRVVAVTRSHERAGILASNGVDPIVGDLLKPESLHQLPDADTVLMAVSPDRSTGAETLYAGGLQVVLDQLPSPPNRFIYISSTGVYGQNDGQWVDEESICEPQRDGGKACLAAERLLAQHPIGQRAFILRLAGLYGPGRIPLQSQIVSGLPIGAPQDGHLNLIHVDDAAEIVILAEQRATPPRTYVVSDGHPVLRIEYYRELARLLEAPPPVFETPDPRSHAAARAGTNKRIRADRMFAELQPQLMYADFRSGLAASVDRTA